MRKILIVLLFSIFLFSLVNAEVDYTAQYNKGYSLNVPCFNNGTFCSSSFVCNLTYISPTGDIPIKNLQMTFNPSYYNFTLNASVNNQVGGIYNGIMSCTNGVVSGGDTFTLEVTGDGFKSLPFPWQFAVVAIGFILIGVGKASKDLSMFQTIGSVITFVMGIVTLYPGYSGINYSTLLGLGLGTIGIGSGFYFLIESSFSKDRQVDHYNQDDDGRYND